MKPHIFNMTMVVDELEKAQGTNAKKKVLEKYVNTENDLYGVHQFFKYALSNRYTFGLTTWDGYVAQPKISDPMSAVVELLDSLANRQLTGHAARNMVGTFAEMLDEQASTERWFLGDISPSETLRRIITKDLRVGVSSKTVNAVVPGLVDVFEVQLAPSEQFDIDKAVYPFGVEPKWDGMRLPAVPIDEAFSFFSRDGELQDNFEEMEILFNRIFPPTYVIDGELLDRVTPFSSFLGRAKSKRGTGIEKAQHLSYIVFDILTLDEWERKVTPPSYSDRRKRMEEILNNHVLTELQTQAVEEIEDLMGRTPSISLAPVTIVNTREEFETAFEEYLKVTPEGVMIKILDRSYEFDRTDAFQKIKPFIDAEGEIVGVEEKATGKNKAKGFIKSITVRGEASDARRGILKPVKFETNIGTGIPDDLREYLTEEHKAGRLLGRIVDLTIQELSQNKKTRGTDMYSGRFPSLSKLRGEVPGEKL